MKPRAPTLIDELYRLSFSNRPVHGWRSNTDIRHALHAARRFVVDEPMSVFMADLTNEAFVKVGAFEKATARSRRVHKLADSLCVSARLPHESIWIEYHLHPYQGRSAELRGLGTPDYNEIPDREGWLIQQHPAIETACIMHLFTKANHPHEDGNDMWTFPLAFGWTCDGSPLPWRSLIAPNIDNTKGFTVPSTYLVGLAGYNRENVNCVLSPLIDQPDFRFRKAYTELLSEWTGIIRRVWALLATLDHLPVVRSEVRQAKGFLARGRIRKFLDHQTITISIPGGIEPRVLARKAITMAHRKRHEVRGFWRDDWRYPPSRTCKPHLWSFLDQDNPNRIVCSQCHGRQSYVPKHERGDSRLGYVTHDYNLTH